jgi:TolB-like protein
VAAATLALAVGLLGYVMPSNDAAPASTTATLAVLPFKPLAQTDRNESLELGMAETLIAVLNSDSLRVSPLSSVRRPMGI